MSLRQPKEGHFLFPYLPSLILKSPNEKIFFTSSFYSTDERNGACTGGSQFRSLAFADQWQNRVDRYSRKISPNDKIRFATIGMGIMGNNDTNTALKVPGTELVAVC